MTAQKMLEQYRTAYGLLAYETCSREDTQKYFDMLRSKEPLPENIRIDTDSSGVQTGFYAVSSANMTDLERLECVLFMQMGRLNSIRKHLRFFTALLVLSILGGAIWGIWALSHM